LAEKGDEARVDYEKGAVFDVTTVKMTLKQAHL